MKNIYIRSFKHTTSKNKNNYRKRERPGESNNFRERLGEGRIVVFVIEVIKICEAKTKSSYLDSMVVLLQWV
jgi:hypothetical protein